MSDEPELLAQKAVRKTLPEHITTRQYTTQETKEDEYKAVKVTDIPIHGYTFGRGRYPTIKYYFMYPDTLVNFAYEIPKYSTSHTISELKTEIDAVIPNIEREVIRILPKKVIEQLKVPGNFILIYPIDISGKIFTRGLIEWIGYLQFLRLSYNIPSLNNSILSKFHLGSPHLFYRWIVNKRPSDSIEYEVVNYEPMYPRVRLSKIEKMLPIGGGSIDTMLVSGDFIESVVPDDLTAPYDPTWGGIYCGDIKKHWHNAYKFGKAGNFEKCLELYNRQSGHFPVVRDKPFREDLPRLNMSIIHPLGDINRAISALGLKILRPY